MPESVKVAEAFSSKEFWMIVDLSSSNLRKHVKLALGASDGSGARWSPSYSFVVALRVEANIVHKIFNKSKTINERKMQQMKIAEK
jgi:hypothetical protein